MFWYDSFLEDSTKITLTSPSSSCVNDLLNQNVPFHQSSHWAKDIRIWVQGCSGDWNLWFKIYQRKKSCKEVPGIYTGILPWICNRMSLCIHKVPLHNVTGVLSEILEVVHWSANPTWMERPQWTPSSIYLMPLKGHILKVRTTPWSSSAQIFWSQYLLYS